MAAKVSTFLMFEGKAGEAMSFYVGLFDGAAVTSIRRYGPGEAGKEGSVVDTLFRKLSEGGQIMMPLDTYPFSRKFAWVADRFGVSWQISLPNL
jgi:predicted 3-demethylubiquinone-9 3-methyltransferase (glyoxalase superfamily)